MSEYTLSKSSFIISAGNNENGSDTFTYIVVDGKGGSATGNVTVTVAGTVSEPQIQLSKTELLFGDVVVGSRDSVSLDISNPGNGDLVISNIVIGDQMFSVSNQSFTVAANASHTLQMCRARARW